MGRIILSLVLTIPLTGYANAQGPRWKEATSLDIIDANYAYIEKRFGPAKSGRIVEGYGYITYVVGRCSIQYDVREGTIVSYSFTLEAGCETALGGNWDVGRLELGPSLTYAALSKAVDGTKPYATCLGNCAYVLGNAADPSFGLRYDSGARQGISIEFETDSDHGNVVGDRWENAIRAAYSLPETTYLPMVSYECRTQIDEAVIQWLAPLLVRSVTVRFGAEPLGGGKCDELEDEMAKAKREGRDYTPG